MKRIACSSLLMACVFATEADAQPIQSTGNVGLGLGSGTGVNGLSMKYFVADTFAVQGNVGVLGGRGSDRFSNNGGIGVSLDLLIENGPLASVAGLFDLGWSYGVGGGLGLRDESLGLAAAGVLGLEVNFSVIPLDLVVEYRPTLSLLQDVDLDLVDFSGHIRFYFQ